MSKWYHYWDKNTGKHLGVCMGTLDPQGKYVHQEIIPPEMPKPELEDGWYLVEYTNSITGDADQLMRRKSGDRSFDNQGRHCFAWDKFTVLKKITMEEIE